MAIITKRRKAFTVIYQQVDENGVCKQIYETYYDYQSALVRKNEVENTCLLYTSPSPRDCS